MTVPRRISSGIHPRFTKERTMSQPVPENSPESQPATPPPAPPATPPATAPAPHPGSGAAPHPRSGADNPFSVEAAIRGIHDTLNALPEKLVNGVREAGQAAAPAPVVNPPQETQESKRKSFGEWWFTK